MPLTIKLIRNIILSLLMLVAILASSLYFYWHDLRSFMIDMDSDIREHYLARVQGPYERLLEEFLKDSPAKPELMQQMLELEQTLHDVQHSDRLTPVKLDLLEQLSLYHESQKDYDSAIYWQQKLIDFFPKNIDFHYKLAELKFDSGNHEAGMQKLAYLFELLPENNRIAERYLPALLADKNYQQAYEGLLQFLRLRTDAPRNEWGYFFSPKKNFSREFSDLAYPEITPGIITLNIEVPGDTSHVRLDMPNHSVITIQRFEFSILHKGKWHTLPEKTLKTQGIRRTKKFLFAPGNANQLMVWKLPENLRSEQPKRIRARFHYLDNNKWVSEMLEHEAFFDFMQSLEAENRLKDQQLMQRTLISSLRRAIAVFSVGKNRLRINGGLSLDPETGILQFSQNLKRKAFREKVEVFLPGMIAARYRIALVTGETSHDVTPLILESRDLLIDQQKGLVQVKGKDPFLKIDLSGFNDNQPLTIKGEVL